MNMLKESSGNFQLGGKDELNLELTVFFTADCRNLKVLNPGIKPLKDIWNLKRLWITPKSLSDFRTYCQVCS